MGRQPQTAQDPPDGATVDDEAMGLGQFRGQFIKRDLAPGRHARLNPIRHRRQLTVSAAIALPPRRQRSGLAPQLHQIVDELRRHTKVPRRLTVPVALIDIGNNSRS